MAIETHQALDQLRGEINVTPMIDILLVLLIIFMIIAPRLPHGLGAALPQRSIHLTAQTETPIIVQVLSARDGSPSYKINQDNVSVDELGSRLSALLSARADKAVFVKGEGDIDFSTIARIVDIGKGAGADRIGLLTSQDALGN
jgi:biopolymer transport protein TolR